MVTARLSPAAASSRRKADTAIKPFANEAAIVATARNATTRRRGKKSAASISINLVSSRRLRGTLE